MFGDPVIVAGTSHVPLVRDQLGESPVAEIIVEPMPRQTAAAVALAALRLPEDTVMLVSPSDHHIEDTAAFVEAARAAAELAGEGWLVCMGVTPAGPDTNFGYVRRGEALDHGGFRVARFVEKPDPATAARYVESGEYAWNAGIFAFRACDFLRELELHRPAIASAVRKAVAGGTAEAEFFRPDGKAFAAIEPESVDYAVMENTERAAMVMTQMGWSDVGNWDALLSMRDKDGSGNTVRGPAVLIDSNGVLVDTDGPKVHVIGLDDIVVVVDGEDILVASRSGSRMVGKLSGGNS